MLYDVFYYLARIPTKILPAESAKSKILMLVIPGEHFLKKEKEE